MGESVVGLVAYAVEWSGGNVLNLGGLPGSEASSALSISDAGQIVGYSYNGPYYPNAAEWSGGAAINLGGLPGVLVSEANSINDFGVVVGSSSGSNFVPPPPPLPVPEPSTWAMMLAGFASLGLAGYRRAKGGSAS